MKKRRARDALVRTITRGPAVGTQAIAVVAVLVVSILVIGAIDSATGTGITFGPLYLVPVLAAAALCATRVAMGVAATGAIAWSIASYFASDRDLPGLRISANSVLRFLIFGLVVLLIAALRDAVHDARQSEQRSQDFLAFAAHQLRTPTAAASTAAQTLLAHGGTPENEELLVRIAQETRRAGRLVASILQYLRMHHHSGLPRTPINLDAVCREAIDRSRDVASMVTMMPCDGETSPPVVNANADALIEAVCCLLDNARRHARSTVQLRTNVHDSAAELIVSDDGPGLPPGHQEEVFAPFVSIDGRGGTGLGLAIARGLVEGQDGTLDYEGGDFVIRVPLESSPSR